MGMKALGNEEMRDRDIGAELATKAYEEALRLSRDARLEDAQLDASLLLNAAEAHARAGQWEKSDDACCHALELDLDGPAKTKALFRRGRARLRAGRAAAAAEDLRRAAGAAPQDRVIREEL